MSLLRDILGESPVWCSRERRLLWVDVRAPALRRLNPESGDVESWPLPEVTAAVLLRESGGVILALKSGLHAFDPGTAQLSSLLPIHEGHAENRLNDAKCDRRGRIWFSTMWDFGRRATGALYRLQPDLTVDKVRSDVTIPNAIAFAPDDRTIYFADTPTRRLEAAAFDVRSGEVGPWRVLADESAAPGKPDGATVDAEGFVWNARFGGGCLARFAPDGRLDRLVPLPVSQPTSCAFGGADLATLYVTTATQALDAATLGRQPLAGHVLALDVGVSGLPEPAFAG